MRESQKIMMQHSEVKIQLLRLYLERYLNILTQSKSCGDIYLYDLFCGEGIYESDSKGSPIVILETIKNVFLDRVVFCTKCKMCKSIKSVIKV